MEREVYKDMDAEEIKIQEDSLRPLVLQKVSQAVIAEMRNFPGMSRADVAEALNAEKLKEHKLTPRSVKNVTWATAGLKRSGIIIK